MASSSPTQVAPGQTITLETAEAPEARSVSVTLPDGSTRVVPVDASGTQAAFSATAQVGLYRYRIGKAEDAFVVNCGQAGESDVRPAEDLGIKAEALDAAALAESGGGRRALWPVALLAALTLLLLETVLFHRRVFF